jgi:hypothetical protein
MPKTKEPTVPDDAALTVDVSVQFQVPYRENEQRRRKPLDILGIDATELTDTQIQDALDAKAAELLETAALNVNK